MEEDGVRIGHFTPAYTPICPGQTAQLLREQDTLDGLGYEYRWWAWELSDIVAVRNMALKQALEWDLDYLVMQDSDVWSKSSIGAVAPLLSACQQSGAAMVAALVGLRQNPHRANVQPVKPGELYEAEKVGTGLVLIDLAKIRAVEKQEQWFGREYNAFGDQIVVGEDIYFCRNLQRHGLKVYVEGRIPTTHANKDVTTLDYPGAAAAGR